LELISAPGATAEESPPLALEPSRSGQLISKNSSGGSVPGVERFNVPLAIVLFLKNIPTSKSRAMLRTAGPDFRWRFFLINQGAGDTGMGMADPVVLHSLKCEVISASARCSHLCASINYFEPRPPPPPPP